MYYVIYKKDNKLETVGFNTTDYRYFTDVLKSMKISYEVSDGFNTVYQYTHMKLSMIKPGQKFKIPNSVSTFIKLNDQHHHANKQFTYIELPETALFPYTVYGTDEDIDATIV